MARTIVNRGLIAFYFLVATSPVYAADALPSTSIENTFNNIVNLLKNLNASMNQVWFMLVGLMYTLGIYFTVSAMFKLKKFGQRNAFMQVSASLIGPAATLLVGVMLMYFPTTLKVLLTSIYMEGAPETLAYSTKGAGFWTDAILSIREIIQVVGLIAFIRGWILIVRSAGENAPPGQAGKGTMHVLGGLMAINIVGTVNALTATVSGSGN